MRKILPLIALLVSLSPALFGMGSTETTMENLKRDLSEPEGLAEWFSENLVYRMYANDGIDHETYPALKSGVADCDDYATIALAWLKNKHYSPILVVIGSQDKGVHCVCLFWAGGWKFFNNHVLVTCYEAKTYQDIGYMYSRYWDCIIVYDKNGLKKHVISKSTKPIELGK